MTDDINKKKSIGVEVSPDGQQQISAYKAAFDSLRVSISNLSNPLNGLSGSISSLDKDLSKLTASIDKLNKQNQETNSTGSRREEADNSGPDTDGQPNANTPSQLEKDLGAFQGAKSAQKIIVIEYEEESSKPEFKPYSIQNNDKLFEATEKSVEARIIKGFSIPKELINAEKSSGLSNGGEKKQAICEFNDNTAPDRLELSDFQTQLIGSLDGDNLASKFKNQNLFYYYNAQQPMQTGVLDCNTIANTFVYAKSGAQNITPGTYRNLSIIGSGVKKLLGNVSILNTYTLSSPAILDTNGFILTNP